MPNRILDSPLVNWTGGTTVMLSVWMKSMEWLNIADFNDVLISLTSVGGIVFIIFKIIALKKSNKLTDLEIRIKEKELSE